MNLQKALRYRKMHSVRFFKYFLSYITLYIVLLAILGIIVYSKFISALQTEIEMSNVASLTQVKDTIDMRFKEMERIVININSNETLKSYKIMEGGYDSLGALKELAKYKSSNEFIYDIALYCNYKGKERIFTPQVNTSLDTFFSYVYDYERWGSRDFLRIVNSITSPVMVPAEMVRFRKSDEGRKGIAAYIYPLSINTAESNSVVMFLIDEEVIKNLLVNAIKANNGYAYVLDAQNKPVVYLSKGEETDISSEKILKSINEVKAQKDINQVTLNDKDYSFVKLKSDYNGWSYITVVQTSQFIQKAYDNRKLFNYTALITFLIGGILAFIFANGNYKPLRKLMEIISVKEKEPEIEGYIDEFEIISSTISEVSRENTGLVKQLKHKGEMIRGELLIRLMKGKSIDLDYIKSMGDISGVTLDYAYFTVMVFLVDDYARFKKRNDEKNQDLIMFSIINVAEEFAREMGCGYGVELIDERGITLLVNCREEYNHERYYSKLAFKTKDFFKQHFGFTLSVGVGNTYDNIFKVNDSFLEANRAVYYRLIKGYDRVIFYEEAKVSQEKGYRYPVEQETELILAMKQGKSSEVERITKGINVFLAESMMSPESVQCICFSIINAVIKCLDEMNIEAKDCFNDEKESLFAQSFETIDDVGERLLIFCSKICNYIERQKESKNYELRDKIMELINERYNDSELCLELIASKCGGLSPSYISRYFKDQTGYPLMQYIDMMRMNRAKELLRETSMPLREIINHVGYMDESNFIRKFKKKEGITPAQYRNLI